VGWILKPWIGLEETTRGLPRTLDEPEVGDAGELHR
jgi:hypothetical protein